MLPERLGARSAERGGERTRRRRLRARELQPREERSELPRHAHLGRAVHRLAGVLEGVHGLSREGPERRSPVREVNTR